MREVSLIKEEEEAQTRKSHSYSRTGGRQSQMQDCSAHESSYQRDDQDATNTRIRLPLSSQAAFPDACVLVRNG